MDMDSHLLPERQKGHSGEAIVEASSTRPSFLREIAETLILALLMYVLVNLLTARIQVDGSSMEPSFHDKDAVVVYKLAYRFGEIERGDVIVFPYPLDPELDYIKRVIGLPGDRVRIDDNVVYVNDQPLEEPYTMAATNGNFAEIGVPLGHVFVLGDNRNDSGDSRFWGTLPIDTIVGKAIFVYWPLDSISLVQHPDTVFASP